MITGIRHIGWAVYSIDETLDKLKEYFGAEEIDRRSFPQLGQTSALVRLGDGCIELMEPLGREGVVPAFLVTRGEGLHHVSLRTDDVAAEQKMLESKGVRCMGGDEVIFTHPKSTGGVVFEITTD